MKHVVEHDLGVDLARKATDAAFASYRERFRAFAPSLTWISPTRAEASFSAKGMTVAGTLDLRADAIVFELDVPFLLSPFRARALAFLEAEFAQWKERARRGEVG